ncbi:MAG TPA: GNAT family N-acetyltransferase [Acidimicrobiia bacterium]|nr:GNAT family N-acetyltransferase [Acidimicrobiia bacterium]
MEVRRNDTEHRYELFDGHELVGVADFVVRGDTVVMPHTEIVPHRRGHGLGDRLVRAALDDIRATGRAVVPVCWFVADFIDRHPEYAG